jgi:hypothetical protein
MSAEGPVFPVAFDELAVAEDLARLSQGGVEALEALGRELDRLGGLPRERLMACEAEGRDGTRLGGCVKTYVPWPAGRCGAVMAAVSHPERPVGLRVIAFGIRHQPPRGARVDRLSNRAPAAEWLNGRLVCAGHARKRHHVDRGASAANG